MATLRVDHKAEAERITGNIMATLDTTPPDLANVSMADGCALAQVHAMLYVGDRVDALVGVLEAMGRPDAVG
jgi:hypothetical protein